MMLLIRRMTEMSACCLVPLISHMPGSPFRAPRHDATTLLAHGACATYWHHGLAVQHFLCVRGRLEEGPFKQILCTNCVCRARFGQTLTQGIVVSYALIPF